MDNETTEITIEPSNEQASLQNSVLAPEPVPNDQQDVQRTLSKQPEEREDKSSTQKSAARGSPYSAKSTTEFLTSIVGTLSWSQPNLTGTTLFSDGWLLQDSSQLSGIFVNPTRSFSWQMDRFYVSKWIWNRVGGGGGTTWVWNTTHLMDRVELRHTKQGLIAPFGAAVPLAENLISDPTSARSTIINPVLASPDLKVLVTRNMAGRKMPDDTLWGLRLLSLYDNWNANVPSESRTAARAISAQIVAPEAQTARFRFAIPWNEHRVVNAYYANSVQFAAFLRGLPGHGLVSDELNNYSVIPVRAEDYGLHLLLLAVTSLDNSVWSSYLGMFYVQFTFAGQDHNRWLRQILCSKSFDTRLPGPKGAVIFVLVDETGTAEPTAPRDFGWGQQVPCITDAVPQQADINIWERFVNVCGNGWTDAQGAVHWNEDAGTVDFQDGNFGFHVERAFRWLQDNVFAPGVEEHVYSAAANLWYETESIPQPSPEPVGQQVYNDGVAHGTRVARRGLNARRRLGHYIDLPDNQVAEQPQAVGDVGARIGPNDRNRGAGKYMIYRWPNSQALAPSVVPYSQVSDGTDGGDFFAPTWEWELTRVDPTLTLRGCQCQQAQVESVTVSDLPTDELAWRLVPIPDYSNVQGLPKLKLPAPDNLGRLAVGMNIVATAGVKMGWSSLMSAQQHIQLLAGTVLSGVCGLLVVNSMSPSVWMGLVDPTPRLAGGQEDVATYEGFHQLFQGSGSVCRISEWRDAAAPRLLRTYPFYLRRDNNLMRYFMLPIDYGVFQSYINKVSGKTIVPTECQKLRWTNVMWNGNRVAGWMDREHVPWFVDYVLATHTLDVMQGWPRVRTTAVGDVQAIEERIGFYPVSNLDRMGYEVATGEYTYEPGGVTRMTTMMWSGSWIEQQPNNQCMLCQIVDPILGVRNGSANTQAVYPSPLQLVPTDQLARDAEDILSGKFFSNDGQRRWFFDGGIRAQIPIGGCCMGGVGLAGTNLAGSDATPVT